MSQYYDGFHILLCFVELPSSFDHTSNWRIGKTSRISKMDFGMENGSKMVKEKIVA